MPSNISTVKSGALSPALTSVVDSVSASALPPRLPHEGSNRIAAMITAISASMIHSCLLLFFVAIILFFYKCPDPLPGKHLAEVARRVHVEDNDLQSVLAAERECREIHDFQPAVEHLFEAYFVEFDGCRVFFGVGRVYAVHAGQICKDYEAHLMAAGQDCRAGQPTPGNKAGGLSTLDEKSLGCIRKGGTRPIVEVLEQAARPSCQGAIVMDTAGYDISSVTSMVAGGCNAVIFTTGRGTPTGNAIVPVIKVTGNERTYRKMEDNMDVDVSAIVRGEKTFKECGKDMLQVIQDVCNGKMTKAEAFGFSDIAVDHVCRFV